MAQRVTVDRDGIKIDGQPFYLLSGCLHYFRYPRAEWRDLLLKARACGLNTVDTVIPWNLHEPEPGQLHFAGDADLAAYLDLCQELGLFVIVRPGPYICAEWENGGLPAWLTARAGALRVDDPAYLEATLRWFGQLFPLLTPRQVTRGGPILLCQIENEHWASGRYGNDTHQATLAEAAEEFGIDVPQYTCMGAMPGIPEFRNGWNGIAEKLLQTRAAWPDNPMIISELWSGWFDSWGASQRSHKTPLSLDRVLQQVISVGCSGFSHWMLAGGTNFGFWGGRTVGGDSIHMTTSYDYDALIGEYGELREKYYVARRHHLLLGTLGAGLAQALADAPAGGPQVIGQAAVPGRSAGGGGVYRSLRARPGAPAEWRDFAVAFLDNPGPDGLTYQLFLKQPAAHLAVEVEAGTIKPVFANLPLGDSGLRLEFLTSRLLGFWRQPDHDILVVYGFAGEVGELQATLGNRQQATGNSEAALGEWQGAGAGRWHSTQPGHLRYWIEDAPALLRARYAGRELLVVLLTQDLAARWWPLADGGALIGPDLAAEDAGALWVEPRAGQPIWRLSAEGQLQASAASVTPSAQRVTASAASPQASVTASAQRVTASAASPQASAASVTASAQRVTASERSEHHPLAPHTWQRHAVAEREDTAGWQGIERPLSFDELGCYLGYGWYRAEFEATAGGPTTLVAPGLSDRARVLLDGSDIGWIGTHPWGSRSALPLELALGHHELRLCVDNLGRFNYGSNTGERKGLLDTLYLGGRQEDISAGWTALWQEAVFAGEALASARTEAVRADASGVHLGRFAFQGPSVWLLRAFQAEAGMAYLLQLTGDRNPGALFVNGVAAERFSRHRSGGLISRRIDDLVRPGRNVIALNIQGYAGFPWKASLLSFSPAQALRARWSFRAGLTPADSVGEPSAGPAFFRTTFAYDLGLHGAGPLRISPRGLTKGQLWINGHNLGRYWQIGPQEHYKLPVSWLLPENELLVFDEEGADPTGLVIVGR